MHRRFFPIAVVLRVLAAPCRADAFPNGPYYGYQRYAPVIGLPAAWGVGTSFAAPLAAGAAALAWSINPLLTPDGVYAILKETAVDLGTHGSDQVFGWGRIDIGAVAERASQTAGRPRTGDALAAGPGRGGGVTSAAAAGWRHKGQSSQRAKGDQGVLAQRKP